MRKFILSCTVFAALCVFSVMTHATQLAYDDATNYGAGWTNNSNGGFGFEAWEITSNDGGQFIGDAGEQGPNNEPLNTNDLSFALWADDFINADRDFDAALQEGNVFSFSLAFQWDNGNRGFDLYADEAQVFNFNINDGGYSWTDGGSAPMTEWEGAREDGVLIHVEFTATASGFDYAFESPQDTNLNVSGSIASSPIDGFRMYVSGAGGGTGGNMFFNNLEILEGEVPPLRFIDGEATPETTGDIVFTLQRTDDGDGEDQVDLSSSNEDAVTVPALVTFAELADDVTFTGTVVSVTEGGATIFASNTVTGSTAQFDVNPQPPTLWIDGPFDVFELGTEEYTLNRLGAVGDDIVFSSTDTNVLTVPAMESFDVGENALTFDVDIVGFGFAQIVASNEASGAWADYGVNVNPPSLTLTGQDSIREGLTREYTLTRVGPVGDTVTLSNSAPAVLDIPASVDFPAEEDVVTFAAEALSVGSATIFGYNADATGAPIVVAVTETPVGIYDEGSFYTGGWTNGSNEGVGFEEWSFNHIQDPEGDPASFAGVFIGDPAFAGISGMDAESFGFFANPAGSGANAEVARALSDPLTPGDTFRFQWGLHFDSNDEASNRGFNLLADTNQLLNVNMGNSAVITISGAFGATNLFEEFGSQAVLLHFEYVEDGSIRVWGTGRDGVEEFDETLAVASGAPDNFAFYFNATDAATDERQMYVNNLQVLETEDTTDGIPNSWWDTFGIPEPDRIADEDFDGDGTTNWEEWIAGTDPTDNTSTFDNTIAVVPVLDATENTLTLMSGEPTFEDRRYDAYWTEDLTEEPQTWTAYGLNVPGNPDNSAVELTVDIDEEDDGRIYRTGVSLP